MGFSARIVVATVLVASLSMMLAILAERFLASPSALWLAWAGITLLMGMVGWGIARHLGRPLAEMHAHIEAVARDSDLARRLPVRGHDEWSRMAQALNQMFEKFNGIVQKIMDETTQLTSAAETMSATAEHTRRDILRQQSETDQVATAIDEMSATVSEVARNTSSAAQAADQASREAAKGKEVIRQAMDYTDQVAGHVREAGAVVENLENKSRDIGAVLDVIRDIAEQTNLLALNAAIEAARAGEQGRGFAVVADEVRSLASRTQESTVEIQAMIEQLQGEARRAVQSMEQSHAIAGENTEHTRQAQAAFEAIAEMINEINDMNTQIASASEEQSAVSEEIHRNVVVISDVARQTSEGSGHITEASERVSNLAEALQGLVRQFRVADQRQFDFGAARAAHLAWKTRLRSFLDGRSTLTREQAVSHRHCVLGKWYYGEGLAKYGHMEEMQAIEAPHEALHDIIGRIIECKERGDLDEAERLYRQVEPLSARIVGYLDSLATRVA
ncbi:MAG TPA: HAMP domain-containing protein [Gammaproteobacteria bacterium]|nr:HAMP domain-containing protein [Gammaproteobacteria bacterium]